MLPGQEARLRAYMSASLNLLEDSLASYREGRLESYRVAAVQLRLLLCDQTRRHERIVDISLARRLWPELRLHPLAGGAPDWGKLFDRQGERLALEDWLEQMLTSVQGQPVSIRRLIRTVCDQDGGAHVDLRLRDPLLAGPAPDLRTAFHVRAVVAAGEYVLPELRALRAQLRP